MNEVVPSSPALSLPRLSGAPLTRQSLCNPILDIFGQCHCEKSATPHVPVLVPMRGRVFPPCRDKSFRAMYIDDSVLASVVRLDLECVPLLKTLGPFGRMDGCGLGIPGAWFSLEHRLRDIEASVLSVGMKINAKKTTLMVFNPTTSRQCIPFCSLVEGDPLPTVGESHLLGLVFDEKLPCWPIHSFIYYSCTTTIMIY